MFKKVSKGSVAIIAVIIVAFAAAAYGIAKNNWAPLCYLILTTCLILFFYNMYTLLEDRLERHLPLKPTLSGPPGGEIDVEVICTKYLMGNGPIYIDLNGMNIGKMYRGRTAIVRLPKGFNRISAYRDKKEMIINEGVVERGSSLMVWCENAIPPKYHVAFLKENEDFDEKEAMASYKKIRKFVNGFTYEMMPFGIIGIAVMIFAMKYFFGYL